MNIYSSIFRKWSNTVLIVLLFADFSITGWHFLHLNRYSGGYQGNTLAQALHFKENTYQYDGNQNPFYFWFLSTFAKRDVTFFTWAKISSFIIILLALLGFFLISRDVIGPRAGVVAFFWMASNWIVIALSFHLRAEVFLLGFFLAAWYAVIKGFKNPRWWVAAGIFAGFAYQVKGTGQLLTISFLLSVPFIFKKDWKLYRRVLIYIFFYALVASPLWVLNSKTFGDPFYNWSIKHAMWLDSWWDQAHLNQLPTLTSTLSESNLSEILNRLVLGIWHFIPVFVSIFNPHRMTFPQALIFWPWVSFVVAGTLIYFIKKKKLFLERISENREMLIFSGILGILFFVLFSWYQQVSSSERFVLVLIPIGFCLFAKMTVVLWDSIKDIGWKTKGWMNRWMSWGRGVILGAVFFSFIFKVFVLGWENPFQTDRLAPWVPKVLQFVEQLPPEERMAVTTLEMLPIWLLKEKLMTVEEFPYIVGDEDWEMFVKDSDFDWILITDPEAIARSVFLQEHIRITGPQSLEVIRVPTGLRRSSIDLSPGAILFEVVRRGEALPRPYKPIYKDGDRVGVGAKTG